MTRTTYDPEADAMFVWFGPEGVKSAETEEFNGAKTHAPAAAETLLRRL